MNNNTDSVSTTEAGNPLVKAVNGNEITDGDCWVIYKCPTSPTGYKLVNPVYCDCGELCTRGDAGSVGPVSAVKRIIRDSAKDPNGRWPMDGHTAWKVRVLDSDIFEEIGATEEGGYECGACS